MKAPFLTADAMPSKAEAALPARVAAFVAQVAEDRATLAGLTEAERATAHAYERELARKGIPSETDRWAAAIAKVRARTPEGLRAKARAAVWHAGGDDATIPRILANIDLVGSILADLTGIGTGRQGVQS